MEVLPNLSGPETEEVSDATERAKVSSDKTLFVDDEPDFERLIRLRFRHRIRSGDLAVEFARDGREALEKIASDPEIAIVMTDINMPVMDGLTLLTEVGKMETVMPVVIISAYGDMKNIRTAMNLGAFDFLLKPIDFDDLEITQRKTLEHARDLREKRRLEDDKRRLEDLVRFTRETFGRYLSDAVVKQLLEDPNGRQLGGDRRDVSVLMSDLRGFSFLAESLPPEHSLAILNNYFETMIDVIIDHGGLIDELLGDAMLVIFGAPLAQEDHALRATACAVAMQLAMKSVNEENVRSGLPPVEMGIGISSGEVVVGNIGSRKRTKFGVVGTNVNLAARIESRTIGGQILVSESTYRRCQSLLEVDQELEFIAKGFRVPIKCYDLRGIGGRIDRWLPARELHLVALAEAVPLRMAALTDRDDVTYRAGEFVRISERAGEIRVDQPEFVDLFVPVRIQILNAAGEIDCDELYAKVIEETTKNSFVVFFTSVPPNARDLIKVRLRNDGAI